MLLLASVPAWVWAMLIMIGFVALSALTMWLVRIPLRQQPPSVSKDDDPASKDELRA
jgi:hypothetical protein